ncbi:purine-binding chemotaxis protein CheW [bacterium]|nr:purine-binding chemotaxis protein CheW [bacterium]
MSDRDQYLIFVLDKKKFAINIKSVKRIALSVEVTDLPEGPGIVMGIINVKGQVIPVVNIRKRFGMPGKDIDLMDHFIITKTSTRIVAMVVDDVIEITKIANNKKILKDEILPGMKHVAGALKIAGDIVLIHDIESFLSLGEEREIDKALKKVNEKAKKGKKTSKK